MSKKLLVIMLVSLSFQFVSNQAALGMQENQSSIVHTRERKSGLLEGKGFNLHGFNR